jgi:DNA segregation ATPase FtsK/SpoIIIE, S-DNA-T family
MSTRARKENRPKDNFVKGTEADEPAPMSRADWKGIALLRNERARRVAGFFLVVAALFMLISFISFFFTWKSDQDIMVSDNWGLFRAENPDAAANAMGLLGAWVSYLFVYKGFGAAAFLFLPFILALGVYLLSGWKPFPLLALFVHSLLMVAWVSLLLGFLFQAVMPLFGGAFGHFGVLWIQGLAGIFGAFLAIGGIALIYMMVFFNFRPFPLKKKGGDAAHDIPIPEPVRPAAKPPVAKPEPEPEPEPAFDMTLKTVDELIETEATIMEDEPAAPVVFEVPSAPPRQRSIIPEIPELKVEIPQEEAPVEAAPDLQIFIPEPVNEEPGEQKEHYGIDTLFDPTLELRDFVLPGPDLLTDIQTQKREIDTQELETSKNLIIETLRNYNIGISQIKASIGPTVTLYEIVPAPGVKISRIKSLEDDIALSLAALGIRIIAPIPGKGTIGIEVPNKQPEMVSMRSVMSSRKFIESDFQLPVALGKTISNEIFIADLAKMPHLLMAGATGQGKSVGLNAILVSLLYRKHPAYVKLVLVDPKKVELTLYNKIERHYLAKLPGDGEAIITDNQKVINTLNSLCVEMDDRYKLLQDAMVRNIVEYNDKFRNRKLNPNDKHRFLPYIVVVIDEVADLMMTAGKEIETPIARIAQLARAVGIHLILATQRPSVNVITGIIKANFPARIAFRVTSKIDSRTILDNNGADQLIGKGDMLFSGGQELIRLQCPFVDTPEVERICEFIGSQRGFSGPYLLPEVREESGSGGSEDFDPNERDALFEEAARIVVNNQMGSTSLIQRRLKIGYNRAGRLIDQLEHAGIVGPFEGSKARQVLVQDEYSLEQFLKSLNQ